MATTFATLADREAFNRRRRNEYAQNRERIIELRRLSDGRKTRKFSCDRPYFLDTEKSSRLALNAKWATTDWRMKYVHI